MSGFQGNHTSGSGAVAQAFLEELRRWAAADSSRSARELLEKLVPWLRAAQAAQPSFALVHRLAARGLEVAESSVAGEDSPAEARRALEESCAAETADLDVERTATARRALELLGGRQPWIATLSSSGAVRDAIVAAQSGGLEPRVLVAESRPLMEGRTLAKSLVARGVPVWLVVDAALPLVLSQAQQLWIGADAVTDAGVLNKVGSYAAALAAREHSVPVYALASRRKFLPSNTPVLKILEMSPAEVWEAPPAGARPRNVYFEMVPLELFRGIVVEDAVLPPTEAAALARERPLPAALAGG